jgi:thioredoxin 1
MAGSTIEINDDNFEKSVLQSPTPVLVDFWAPWCGPCVAIGPMLESLAQDFQGKVTVAKMNVDENANIPASLGVRSIPYLAMFHNGQLVDSVVGLVPKADLVNMFNKVIK